MEADALCMGVEMTKHIWHLLPMMTKHILSAICRPENGTDTRLCLNNKQYQIINRCHAVWHDEASSHMVCVMTKQTIDDEAIK